MLWSAAELRRLFHSRTPRLDWRVGGLFDWYAQLIAVGLMHVTVEEYDPTVPVEPIRRDERRGGENANHVHLTRCAARIFSDEPWRSQDVPGYGVSDHTTQNRVIECGNTPPAKLIRSWVAGFDKFTIFPFVSWAGPKYVTLSVEWRTTSMLRKIASQNGFKVHGNSLKAMSGPCVDSLLGEVVSMVLETQKHLKRLTMEGE